jgi:hypothetical protein
MLTRRAFGNLASYAVCSITALIGAGISGQATPLILDPRITRTMLSQGPGPTPGYATIMVETQVEPGQVVVTYELR